MKFIANSKLIERQLGRIQGAVPSKSMLPIIENFLFEVDGTSQSLTASATNLETSMQVSIPIETKERDAKISVAVPVKVFIDTIKNLAEQPITVEITDEFGIVIYSDTGKYKISGEDGTNYPPIPTYESASELVIASEILLRGISAVLFAASNDEDRAALNGMLFYIQKESITFVATDAHRLGKYVRNDAGAEPAKFTVPKKALLLIKNSITSSAENMHIYYNENNAFFVTDNITLVCRLIDQKYPNYENVIPKDNPNKMSINKSEFVSALKRMNIFANKISHQVKLDFTKDSLEISTEDLDYANEAKETLRCIYEGEPLTIGFNAAFLLEVIQNVETGNITMEMSVPNRAAIIFPEEQIVNENILMLIMPIMLNNN